MVVRLLRLPALTWPTVANLFLDTWLVFDRRRLAWFKRLDDYFLWVLEVFRQMRRLKFDFELL